MRKRFTFILALLSIVWSVTAQETKSSKLFYLSESFETEIPNTWTIENTGDYSWEHTFQCAIASSTGYPSLHIAGILTSPIVDVSSATELRLIYKHYFWSIGGASASTEVFDGLNWIEIAIPSNSGEQDIDISDYINDSFQLRFIYDDGNSWDMFWKIFDVLIYTPETNDMAITNISPSAILLGESAIPQITVHNYGVTEGAYDLQLTIEGTTFDETMTGLAAVAPGTEAIIDISEWVFPTEGDYDLTAVLTFTDDNDLSNNSKISTCLVKPYSDVLIGNNNGKYYEIDLDNGDLTQIGSFPSIPFTMADEFANGKVYRITEWLEFWEVAIDGSLTEIEDANLYDQWTALGYAPFTYAMAYDWDTERMYFAGDDGVGWPVGDPHLAYFDMNTYEITYVGPINAEMIVGMDFADDGFLYGVSMDGNLYKMNVDEFDVSLVGSTGLVGIDKDFQDVSYDRASHTLYGMLRDNSYFNKLGTIDLETGDFSIIHDYTDLFGYTSFAITKEFQETYTLTFSVDDGVNPIEGAEITINNSVLVTNASGNASIDLANGNYDYTVVYSDYEDYIGTASIEDDALDISITMDDISGIHNISHQLSISPNPSNGVITINSSAKIEQVFIITQSGMLMQTYKDESIIDLSHLPKGVYFMKIITQDKTIIKKIILE